MGDKAKIAPLPKTVSIRSRDRCGSGDWSRLLRTAAIGRLK